MQYSFLKNTDLKISSLALGTWVFGGDGWGQTTPHDCEAAVFAAQDEGINFIDTAPVYGYGRAEEILGKALKGRRQQFILSTKCGLVWQGKKVRVDLSAVNIRREIEASLKRLGTDYVDVYHCHWPDPKTPLAETTTVMNQLKEEGKIRHIGVSNFDQTSVDAGLRHASIVSSQNPYSLLDRGVETELWPFLRTHGIGIFVYGVLAGGILTGKYPTSPNFGHGDVRRFFYKFYQGEKFERITKTLAAIREMMPRPLNQIAINWARQQPGVTSVFVGCRDARQVKENAAAANWALSNEHLTQIRELLRNYGW